MTTDVRECNKNVTESSLNIYSVDENEGLGHIHISQ